VEPWSQSTREAADPGAAACRRALLAVLQLGHTGARNARVMRAVSTAGAAAERVWFRCHVCSRVPVCEAAVYRSGLVRASCAPQNSLLLLSFGPVVIR